MKQKHETRFLRRNKDVKRSRLNYFRGFLMTNMRLEALTDKNISLMNSLTNALDKCCKGFAFTLRYSSDKLNRPQLFKRWVSLSTGYLNRFR